MENLISKTLNLEIIHSGYREYVKYSEIIDKLKEKIKNKTD